MSDEQSSIFKNKTGKQRVLIVCIIFFVFAALILFRPELSVVYLFWIFLGAVFSRLFLRERSAIAPSSEPEKYPNLAALTLPLVGVQTISFDLMVYFLPQLISTLGAIIMAAGMLYLIVSYLGHPR